MNKKLGTVIALTGIATFTIHMINRVQLSGEWYAWKADIMRQA